MKTVRADQDQENHVGLLYGFYDGFADIFEVQSRGNNAREFIKVINIWLLNLEENISKAIKY